MSRAVVSLGSIRVWRQTRRVTLGSGFCTGVACSPERRLVAMVLVLVLVAVVGECWPPVGARELDVEFLYDRLAEAGYLYGPVFQGLRRAFRVGAEVFAEVVLGDEGALDASGFCVHPALMDSALHALVVEGLGQAGELEVPFCFSGARFYDDDGGGGGGGGVASLRVCLGRDDAGVL